MSQADAAAQKSGFIEDLHTQVKSEARLPKELYEIIGNILDSIGNIYNIHKSIHKMVAAGSHFVCIRNYLVHIFI